jgi:hypothetical protein
MNRMVMRRSMTVLSIVVLALAGMNPSSAYACGGKPCYYHHPTPTPTPKPKPSPTPVKPTSTPVVVVPPASTPSPLIGTAASAPGGRARLSEYCHYEPSTGQWEIRRTTDLEHQLSQGNERPMEAGLCDQHLLPTAQPIQAPVAPTEQIEMPQAVIPEVQAEPAPAVPLVPVQIPRN